MHGRDQPKSRPSPPPFKSIQIVQDKWEQLWHRNDVIEDNSLFPTDNSLPPNYPPERIEVPMKLAPTAILALVVILLVPALTQAAQPGKSSVKVFILAGQSNMEGHGVIEGRPGQLGTLETLLNTPATAAKFKHLCDKDGGWIVRNDVWLSYYDTKCPLTIGRSAAKNAIRPELAFGWVVGDYEKDHD